MITINSGNNFVSIRNSAIHNDTGGVGYAISFVWNSDSEIDNNDIWSSKGSALKASSWSTPFITNNKIEITGSSSNAGVYASSYAVPIFMNPDASIYVGNNEFTGTGRSLYAYGSGTILNAGTSTEAFSNDFCTTGTFVIRSESSAIVYAIKDHWPSGSSSGLVELLTGGTAFTTPEASGNAVCSGPSKMGALPSGGAPADLDPDQTKLMDAVSAHFVGNDVLAAAELTQLINSKSSIDVRVQAIAMLTRVAISTADETLLSFIAGIQNGTPEVEKMRLLALLHGYYLMGLEGAAEDTYRTITNGTQSADAVFDAGMERFYYFLEKGDLTTAEGIFSSLIPVTEDQFSRASTAGSFVGALVPGGIAPGSGKQGPENNIETKISKSGTGISVYPNPFNPSTVFSFELEDSQNVSLRVYDMLGREVAVVADGQMSPGVYNLSFNASYLTTGTYLYQFKIGGKVKSGTLVLVK